MPHGAERAGSGNPKGIGPERAEAAPLRAGAEPATARADATGFRRPPDRGVDTEEAEAARFRVVADAVPHLVWTSAPGGRWTWANRRWTEHTGQPVPEALGHGWLDAVHPDDRTRTLAAWRAADAGGELRVEHRLRSAGGRHRWFATHASPQQEGGPSGGRVFWCGTSTDVEDRRRAEAALRESEERFRSFAEASPAVLWMAGADNGPLQYLSPAYEQVWGEPRGAVLHDRDRWAERLHPEDRAFVLASLPGLSRGERLPMEYRIRRGSDGAVRWIRDVGFPIRDAEGRVNRVGGLALDVTDQREAERRQRLLLGEMNHRVKNALAGVQALAAQIVRGGRETGQTPDTVLRTFEERLLALARAHDLLTREAWQGASLSEVVRGTLAPHADRAEPARVAASGPEVRLTPNAAVALHMAFHELATNAARHGALTARKGTVEVAWSVARGADAAPPAPDDGDVLEIHWRERGGPPVAGPPERRGFGSRLIERGLSRQLGGESRLDFLPGGVEVNLRLPLSARVEAEHQSRSPQGGDARRRPPAVEAPATAFRSGPRERETS